MERDREERIRAIAHRIWEEEGQPVGQEERHWRMAETVVLEEEAERASLMRAREKQSDQGSFESS